MHLLDLYNLTSVLLPRKDSPVDKVFAQKIKLFKNLEFWNYVIKLKPELRKSNNNLVLYSDFDGNGTSKSRLIAFTTAVSEAIERWAYYTLIQDNLLGISYGLNIDNTSTGFAADFVSFENARNRAFNEANERYMLQLFNLGLLNLISEDTYYSIFKRYRFKEFVDSKMELVILTHFENNNYSYGFAASEDFNKASMGALKELVRNNLALNNLLNNVVSDFSEKKIIFYSTKDGYLSFYSKLEKNKQLGKSKIFYNKSHKTLCIDNPVIGGTWDQYAKVWRVLFSPVVDLYKEDMNIFYF